MTLLETFVNTSILAIILCFVRIGTALMVMPGLGDSFVPERVRLLIALSLSVVFAPFIATKLPQPLPAGGFLLALIAVEFVIGAFIGTIARIFMAATDTAGMIVSTQSGLASAQLFNPQFASQGSILGALFSMAAVYLVFVLNLHHLLIVGLMDSYGFFPLGQMPDTGSMSEVVVKSVSASFLIGVQMAAPFLVVTFVMYVAMGVLSKLMPQVQIFLLAIPVQIVLSMLVLSVVFGVMMNFWADQFASGLRFFFSGGG